jgi:carboxymethylenebutenolidase
MGVQTQRERISIETPAGPMAAQLARPASGGPFPGVIVVQEAFGLNPHIEGVADRIAAEGYVALAPDLYHRGGAGRTAGYDDLPTALSLMSELTDGGIVDDIGAAVAVLERHPSVRKDRIGITGFCMGGRVSYLAACALPGQIKAAVPFYGGGIPIDRTATLAAPVLAFFGDEDPFIPLDQVRALEAEAKRLGKQVTVRVYPKAPHGFFCDERDSYRPDAATDAWTRMTGFLAEHLKG